MRKLLLRIINAEISVSSWILAVICLLTSIVLFGQIMNPATPGLAEFDAAMPFINEAVWAGGLILSSVALMIGMAKHWLNFIRYGSMTCFVLWAFGATAFILLGQGITIVILIAPIMLFLAYMFLAAILREDTQA